MFNFSKSHFGNHIYFIRDPEGVNSRKEAFLYHETAKSFTLNNESQFFLEVLKCLPKNFTLTTKNGKSSKFNLRLLQDTSSVIAEFHKENPSVMEYHVDVDDKDNILEKFEKLYQGETVYFDEEELPTSKKITSILNITCCPNYMKPENLKSDEASQDINLGLDAGVGMSKRYFNTFVRSNYPSFTIITKKNKYQCNYYGVISSKVIRDLIIKDPSLAQYEYDFEDENNEFQQVCNLFDFNSVYITSNNMEILKEIAEDLQIDSFLPLIEKNINECEKVSQMIDEQQNTIDLIEDLFGWLYNIEELTVESVKTSILNSDWIKTEDDIHELAAFIIEVINSQFKLHPYLIDLLIQIDKEADEKSQSKNLLPFLSKMLLISNGNSLPICSFIYNLYKRGIISKENLNDFLATNLNISKQVWFLPEIIEHGELPNLTISNNNRFINPFSANKKSGTESIGIFDYQKFINFYYPDKIDIYKKMRDSGEPDDELTKSLRNDDVDKVQSILTSSNIDISTYKLPYNIFEKLKENGEIRLIDYAAAYGSVKCFKYLMLNHLEINDLTFSNAVRGGNIEIIKTVFQQIDPLQQPIENPKGGFGFGPRPIYIDDISPAIENHQNDLFDWIFEQKYSNNLVEKADALLKQSAICGNAHSIIEIIDKCATTCNFRYLINEASKNGFYKLASLIFDIKNKRSADFDNNTSILPFSKKISNVNIPQNVDFVYFNNLSIFKLGIKLNGPISFLFDASLCFCINNDYKKIFDHYFDQLFKAKASSLKPSHLLGALSAALNKESDYYFKHMIEQIRLIKPDFFAYFTNIDALLQEACSIGKFDDSKLILEIIKENKLEVDITQSFILAAQSRSIEICKYIFDQKLKIDFEQIINSSNLVFNKEIYSLILDKMEPEMNEIFLYNSLIPAINSNNKELVEFLLNKNVHYENALIVAARNKDIDIVNIILKHDSSPSFVNRVSEDGTALIIAISNNRLETTKRLLSIPGIDLSLYDKNDQTPLISSIVNLNIDILNVILEFYGEKIQSEIWQIDKAIKMTLTRLSSNNDNQSNCKFSFNNPSYSSYNETDSIEKRKSRLLTIVKRILEIKNIDPNSRGGEHTLLSYACEANEIDIVHLLLQDERIDVNAYAPISGNTPLMIAILNKNVEIAKILINDKRTDINTRNYLDETSLTFAVTKELEEVVNLLIKNEKFDPIKSNINYAFYLSKCKSISQILIDQKSVDINYRCNKRIDRNIAVNKYINQNIIANKHVNPRLVNKCRYETPLTYAVSNCDIDKINLIIQNPSFDRNKSLLNLSIFDSISVGSIPIFRLLLKLIDDDINIKFNNISLLTAAVKYSQKSFISEILNDENFDSEKSDIIEAFIECLRAEDYLSEIAREIYDYDTKNKHLIDLNKPLSNGETYLTLLHRYSIIGPKTQILFNLGADPNIPNANGLYPLELAMYNINFDSDHEYFIFLCDSNRIDFNQQIPIKNISLIENVLFKFDDVENKTMKYIFPPNTKYFTYVHLAAAIRDSYVLRYLLMKGVDINIKDDQGNTPLIYASLNKLNENITLLFSNENLDYLHCNNDGYDALGILDKSKDHPKSKKDFEAKLLISGHSYGQVPKFNFTNNGQVKKHSLGERAFKKNSLDKQPVEMKPSLSEILTEKTNQLGQKAPRKFGSGFKSNSLDKQPVEKKPSLSETLTEKTNQLGQKAPSKFGSGFKSSSLDKQPVEEKPSLSETLTEKTNQLGQKAPSKFGSGFKSSSLEKSCEKNQQFSSKTKIFDNKSSPNEEEDNVSSSLEQSDTNNQNCSATKTAFSSLSSSFTKQQTNAESSKSEYVKTITESLNFEDMLNENDEEIIQNQCNDYQYSLISPQQYQQYQQQWQQLMQISFASQLQFNMQMLQMQSLLNTKRQVTKKKTKNKSKKKSKK